MPTLEHTVAVCWRMMSRAVKARDVEHRAIMPINDTRGYTIHMNFRLERLRDTSERAEEGDSATVMLFLASDVVCFANLSEQGEAHLYLLLLVNGARIHVETRVGTSMASAFIRLDVISHTTC